jgi:hypothetical protein
MTRIQIQKKNLQQLQKYFKTRNKDNKRSRTIQYEAKTFLSRFFTQQQLAMFTTPQPQKYIDYEPKRVL